MTEKAKPRRGRPPGDTPPMTKQNIRVPDDLWERSAVRASIIGITMSEYVRRLLAAELVE